jgi:signal transduction histidine kinase
VLRVGDDGHGALGADLDSGRGLGLRALRERLAARHGSRGSLAIATAPGRGFRATVRLPATREEPAEAASA